MPHVLVIEDNAEAREALVMLLQGWGHRVEAAATVAEAFARVPEVELDAVVLDLGLNDGAPDGDLVHQLRTRVGPAVRLIVYSGYRDFEASAREAGCDDYIVKPDLEGLEALFAGAEGGRVTTRPR
jgi:CheY-like chemotaxis protein